MTIFDIVGLNPRLQTKAMHFARSSSTSGAKTFLKITHNTTSKTTLETRNTAKPIIEPQRCNFS